MSGTAQMSFDEAEKAKQERLMAKLGDFEQHLMRHLPPGSALPTRFEPKEKLLYRFLRSCQGDIEEATNVLLDHIRWREEKKVDELALKSLDEVLGGGVQDKELVNYMPFIERGDDNQGRPVLFLIASKLDARAATRLVTSSRIMDYQIWIRERAFARLDLYGKGSWRTPPYFTLVADLRGVKLNQATGEFYSLMKRITVLDQYQYPGRVGMLVIVNVPFFFQMIWGALRRWISSATERKISICYRDAETKRVLLSLIPQSRLPHDFGGSAMSLPSIRTARNEDFYCPMVHFNKLSVISTRNAPSMRIGDVSLPPVDFKEPQSKGLPSEDIEEYYAPDQLISAEEVVRESIRKSRKPVEDDDVPSIFEPSSHRSREMMIANFTQRLNTPGEKLQYLKDDIMGAIANLEKETNQFERDILLVRARLRRSLDRRSKGIDTRAGFTFPKGVDALKEALHVIEEERDAHSRAVAFARNYIDVQAQEWDQLRRSLRARLERVLDENRGLIRTVQVALGQEALNQTLTDARQHSTINSDT